MLDQIYTLKESCAKKCVPCTRNHIDCAKKYMNCAKWHIGSNIYTKELSANSQVELTRQVKYL